jgi:hypothetical protein
MRPCAHVRGASHSIHVSRPLPGRGQVMPHEISSEVREGRGHPVQPHEDGIYGSAHVRIIRRLEDVPDDNPVVHQVA